MPWKHEWVDPETAIQVVVTKPSTKTHAASVWPYEVYHVYKNDNYCERLCWWYTLHDGHCSAHDTSDYEFDIRTVPTYHENQSHQEILQLAIDRELVTIEDCFIYIQPLNRGSDETQ